MGEERKNPPIEGEGRRSSLIYRKHVPLSLIYRRDSTPPLPLPPFPFPQPSSARSRKKTTLDFSRSSPSLSSFTRSMSSGLNFLRSSTARVPPLPASKWVVPFLKLGSRSKQATLEFRVNAGGWFSLSVIFSGSPSLSIFLFLFFNFLLVCFLQTSWATTVWGEGRKEDELVNFMIDNDLYRVFLKSWVWFCV